MTTTPRSVHQTRTPKFVKLHNGNMHKHTPKVCAYCLLTRRAAPAGAARFLFVCHTAIFRSFGAHTATFPRFPKSPSYTCPQPTPAPVFTVTNHLKPAPVFKPIPLISASRSHIVSNPRFVANEQKSNPAKPDLPNAYPIPYSCPSPPAPFDIN